MEENTVVTNKPKPLLRYVIERIFCHHQVIEKFKVEVKDTNGYTVGINALLVCTECGKTKDIRI